jgi:hypothetical protein
MEQLEEQTHPEILRSNLANTVLELVKVGIKDLVKFDYVVCSEVESQNSPMLMVCTGCAST